jgi:iron complex outermembrane receptor protein
MRRICELYKALCLASAILSSCAAYAQESPATSSQQDSQPQIEEIVVTAEKRSERLADVPMSITAITGEQLREQGVSSVADLQKVVPGLAFTQSPYGAPIVTIRGIGFFDEAVGISPTVSVYVDQVLIPFPRATEGVSLDLQRVEVLKGPQGTLFGQNSTGGAVNYIANKPTTEFKAGGDVSYGRFNDLDVSGFASGPLSDQWSARVAARVEHRGDGWQQSTSRNDSLGIADFKTARLLLNWRPTDSLRFDISADGWQDKSDTQANQFQRYDSSAGANGYPGSVAFPNLAAQLSAQPPAPADNRSADWNPGQNFRRNDDFGQFSLRGEYNISERTTLTSISAYSRLNVNSPIDVDGTRFPLFGIRKDAYTKTYSQELRLAGAADTAERLKWMLGVNYQYDKVSDIEHFADQGSNSGVGPYRFITADNSSKQKIDTRAVFGGVDYKLTDTLTAQASTRYSDQKRTLDGCLIDSGNGQMSTAVGYLSTVSLGDPHVPAPGDPSYIPPGGCVTLDSQTRLPVNDVHKELHQHNVSWRTGLSWEPRPDLLLYGNVTRGYKSGSFATIPAVSSEQLDPVPQESVTAYEIGVRTSLRDRTAQFAAATFYYDYKDKQLLAYISDRFFGNMPGLVSVPKSRVYGAEVSVLWLPLPGLTLNGSATYVHSEVTSDFATLGPLAVGGFVDVKGSSFPNTPEWNAVGDAEYRTALFSSWDGFVGGNATYRSSAASTFAGGPEFEIGGYTLLDARFGVEKQDRSLRVQVWGRNITNRYYWSHVDHVLDTVTRSTGMPLTYGVSVSTRF